MRLSRCLDHSDRATRTRAGAATIVIGGLLAGCAPLVQYTPLLEPPHRLVSHRIENVQVLAVTPPSAAHTDIGLYQIDPGFGDYEVPPLIARLRADAAARGCDAILVTSVAYAARDRKPTVQASCVVYNRPVSPAPPHASPAATAGSPGVVPPPSTATPIPPPGG